VALCASASTFACAFMQVIIMFVIVCLYWRGWGLTDDKLSRFTAEARERASETESFVFGKECENRETEREKNNERDGGRKKRKTSEKSYSSNTGDLAGMSFGFEFRASSGKENDRESDSKIVLVYILQLI
jgi:hypothetical protein